MGRPSTDLSKTIGVRLTDAEYESFRAAAKRLGNSRARLLRRAVREFINLPADLLDQELGALDEAVYQLKAVGRNLNQITRAMHMGELKDSQVDAEVLAALGQAVKQLDRRISEVIEKSRLRRVLR